MAAERRVVEIEPATLVEMAQDILVFLSDREGRMWTTKCRFSDRTWILDEKGNPTTIEALEAESIWMVVLVYDSRREGLPFIKEMRNIHGKAPE